MNRRHLIRLGGIGTMLGVGACAAGGGGGGGRNAPVQNYEGVPFIGGASMAARGNQIRRAGTGLGWVMEDRGPGLIRGTLNVRTHQAVVDIPYNNSVFGIRYVSSQNLDYDGTTIHRNYNGWVERLQRTIAATGPG
ncbi:hypothetical protein [Muricoccus radiodurans]|uniref:hypothetical protein n=1 Tax=Muricoccus radiodurans TaxID=2231721 RepID=UPI003CE68C29